MKKNKTLKDFWTAVRNNIRRLTDRYYTMRHNMRHTIKHWTEFGIAHKHHVVHTGLPPGWVGTNTKILHVNFNLLKDFVECELASLWHYVNPITWTINHKHPLPIWKRFFNRFRSKEYGILYLEWEVQSSTAYLEDSKEILSLYKWWTEERPNRLSPWKEYDDALLTASPSESKKLSKKAQKLEEAYHTEDTKMLIRLMKIRSYLSI
jgi:hypothetical protein